MIFQILIIAWLGVRSRLGRSILTALSLFIGVLAIVVIQAGAGAAQDAVMSNAILTGGRAMTLSLNVSNGRRAFGQADQLLSPSEQCTGTCQSDCCNDSGCRQHSFSRWKR